MMHQLAVLLATAGLAATAAAYTPAYSNGTASEKNSSLLAGWRSDQGQGTLNQGVTLLSNGTSTEQNSSYYGVVVYFNETTAENQTATSVPWIAFVSCDSNPSTQATLTLPFTANGTIATNSTLDGNSTTLANSTDSTNSTVSGTTAANSTDSSSASNSTINGVNSTYLPDVFTLAAGLGASSVFLYSEQAQSCQLNFTADASFNRSIPIFSSPSQEVTNQILSSQFANIDPKYRYFNSSLITSAASNLTAVIADSQNSSIPTEFVIGRLTASFNKNDSSNGVVATIGRAPTSTRTAQGSAQTSNNSSNNPPSSAAARTATTTSGLALLGSLLVVGVASIAV
ncbi:hypothetical protein JCM11491_001133 [Sporobolomyces phaffii]